MLPARLCFALCTASLSVGALVGTARAQDAAAPGALTEIPLPGGLRAALAATGDPLAADHAQFLLEFIRHTHQTQRRGKGVGHSATTRSLLAQLDLPPDRAGVLAEPPSLLPLPLPPSLWIDAVFGGKETPETLLAAILRSRDAALLYDALLSLDDPTRAWLTTQPDLLMDLASRYSHAFLLAAPGFRVADGTVQVPGGDLAAEAWQALVGRSVSEPAEFARALVSQKRARLAYFFAAMAQLPPAHIRFALNLDSPREVDRASSVRRLYTVFDRIIARGNMEERPLWRPAHDPALLVSDLRTDPGGRPSIPGGRRFWTEVFGGADRAPGTGAAPSRAGDGEPVDFVWICEQVFAGDPHQQRRRYQAVLFASRIVPEVTPETMRDAIDAVRAAERYPALTAVLERASLDDVAAFARAARRARQISAISDRQRAHRSLAQFQGALALLTRATLRGSLPADRLSDLVTSLAAVELSARGDYDGGLVRWIETHLREAALLTSSAADVASNGHGDERATGALDQNLLAMLAGPTGAEPRFVDWEGTRYRVDLTSAEAIRLERIVGQRPRPYVSAARAVLLIAGTLEGAELTSEWLQREVDAFEEIADALDLETVDRWNGDDLPQRYRSISTKLRQVGRGADLRGAPRLAAPLRVLADALLSRGLLELAYATALGHPERTLISAREAASRHDFQARDADRTGAWLLPTTRNSDTQGWRVTGSLLGLDVKLADLSLLSLSSRPLPNRPTVGGENRRVWIEAVALVEAALLTDADRDTIVSAIAKGRARLTAARTPAEAAALADEIRLSPARRSLLSWIVARDRERVAAFLAPSELLWLGLEKAPVSPGLHAWGAPAEPRLGCLCLQLLERRPWETLAGRRSSGMLASGFPDLNLRLAELLAELEMPAALLAPVLASATFDFINTATARDGDDRRGLVEFVQALGLERLEQYLALLTTDGPLVPVGDAAEPSTRAEGPR